MPGSSEILQAAGPVVAEPPPARPGTASQAADTNGAATEPSRPHAARIQQLDVLRGVAIFLVLGRHRDVWPMWTRIGWSGVEMFFVLSGFLVSGLLFSEYRRYNRIDFPRFFIRRGFKIYPAFYFFVGITTLYMLHHGVRIGPGQLLAELLFLQNFHHSVWDHTWSLAVEEHFYLLLPLTLLLLIRFRSEKEHPFRRVPLVCAVVGITSLSLRYASLALIHPFTYWWHVMPTYLKIDSLTVGVLLSYCYHFHRERLDAWMARFWPLVAAASALFLLPCFLMTHEHPWMVVWGMTSLYLGYAGLLACAVCAKPRVPDWWRRLVAPVFGATAFVGTYSYSIYLWHMSLNSWGMVKFRSFTGLYLGPKIEFWIYFVWSIALGIVMAKLVELPMLRVREKWFPSRSRPLR